MEKYSLKDLLKFFQRESNKNNGFQNINTILEIYASKKTSKIRKWAIIVSALRYLGLYEEDYEIKEGAVGIETVYMESLNENYKESKIPIPSELYPITMLNGKIIFESVLN